MTEKPSTATSFSPDQIQLLKELFSGNMMADSKISHAETMETLNAMGATLDPDNQDTSLGYFLRNMGRLLNNTDSNLVSSYGDGMKALVAHDLTPAYQSIEFVAETFRRAELQSKSQNPEVRAKLHNDLKKIPAAIDYILGQVTSVRTQFDQLQKNFADNAEYQQNIRGSHMPEEELQDIKFIDERMVDMKTAFNRCNTPVHTFRAHHIQIKNRANELAEKFAQAPDIEQQMKR